MKKILVATVLALFGIANANAQEVQFGAKAGINIATLNGDISKDADAVTAFHFGLMAEIPLSEKFSFQPEVLYSGQGFSLGENSTFELNYLNVPLMGKYYVAKGLSLEAGPQIGFLLSAKAESVDTKKLYKNVDLGVNFGLGYKLDNGLNFEARYNLGLSDVNNGNANLDIGVNGFKNQNGVFQISIGYFFF